MSKTSEEARAAARDKADRMTRSDPHARVDASGYGPEGALDGDVQTGPRVISRRQFRRGGKVEGKAAAPRADRKRRASGGSALTADSYQNRNLKEANRDRVGTKHVGGFASGGDVHEDAAQDRKLIHQEVHKMGCGCARCMGGKVGRKDGGRLQERVNNLVDRSRSGDARATETLDRMMDKPSRSSRMEPASKPAQDLARSSMRMAARKGVDPYNSQPSQASAYRQLWRMKGGRPERASGGATEESGHWIAGAIEHPGSLRKELHVKAGHDIPAGKLEKAEHSKNPKLARKARLAETLNGLHKKSGGSVNRAAINDGTRPTGGRLARKGGGRTKKGTNVNIIIAPQGAGAAPAPRPMPMPPGAPAGVPPAAMPVGLHQGAPPPMMPAGMPPAGMPMRARGGRTYPIDAGAGGGLGRLEKARRAGRS